MCFLNMFGQIYGFSLKEEHFYIIILKNLRLKNILEI